jgi:RNA polymerase sigma-70 factor (ECF subfamily)
MKRVEELVLAHQARLRAYLFARTGDAEAGDDIAQEVFLVVLKRWDEFDASRPAWPWLVTIARNLLHEHWREARRESRVDELEAFIAERQLREEDRAGSVAAHESRMDALRQCLDKLAPESRELVRTIYGGRASCSAAADALGRRPGAVRMAIHRIRRALRSCVESELGGAKA